MIKSSIMECRLMTLTPEEKKRRHEKAVARSAEIRRIKVLRAAKREASIREENYV
jgi:hypothetical protein